MNRGPMLHMLRTSLADAPWMVRGVGDLPGAPAVVVERARAGVPATLPGCVHTDLIDAGLIADPAREGRGAPTHSADGPTAERAALWVSEADWRYEALIEVGPDVFERDVVELVFEGLDTIATIDLNGQVVGSAASEFITHRFQVKHALSHGRNHLAVTFRSPLRHVREEAARLGERPVNGGSLGWAPFVFARKSASNFEWDWGPKVATCGIGGVRLEAWSGVRIESIALTPERDRIRGLARLEWAPGGGSGQPQPLSLRIELGGTPGDDGPAWAPSADIPIAAGAREVAFEFSAPAGAARWRPGARAHDLKANGLRRLRAELTPAAGGVLGEWSGRTALCDVSVDLSTMAFTEGGRPVFCQGANWIPEGLWPRDRVETVVRVRLEALAGAGVNMLRVWGGGRYEPDWFYDLCDELGMMVWQDFMFACGMYPEEPPFPALIEQEAREQTRRLSRHPSVVLWCGGNECIWAHDDWAGFCDTLGVRTWGIGYYLSVLPRVVREEAPGRAYLPNSPWSGMAPSGDAWLKTNEPGQGDRHTWDVWGEGYRTVIPRFCSEFGQQAPSCWATLEDAGLTTVDPAALREPGRSVTLIPRTLLARQRGPGGMERWFDQPLAEWFAPPRDLHEWHYLAQLLQARCLSIGIEWLRANQPTCMGSLIWQANDAWPGLSWSVIDSAGRCKLAYAAMRQAHRPRLLMIQPMAGELQVIASNGADSVWESAFRLRRMSFAGDTLADTGYERFVVKHLQTRSIGRVEALIGPPGDPASEFVLLESVEQRRTWFYRPDRELAYPAASFDLEVETELAKGQFIVVRIRAGSLLRDLSLFYDKLAPGFQQFGPWMDTLLPGESVTVAVRVKPSSDDPRPPLNITPELIRERRALWCANDFGRRD